MSNRRTGRAGSRLNGQINDSQFEAKSDNRRVFKFERELREVISSFLISGFKHRLSVMLSVPQVRATKDFKRAKVYVSFFGKDADEQRQKNSVETLNKYAHEVQSHVGKSMPMKSCPKLQFFSDELLQTSMRVEKLIDNISRENSKKKEGQE